jgi:hypothetical protein
MQMQELRQDLEEGLTLLEAASQPGSATPKLKARVSRLSIEGGTGGSALGWASHDFALLNTCSSTDSLLSPAHGARYSRGVAAGPFGHHVARSLSLPDNLRRQLRRSKSWQGREEKASTALFENSLYDPAASLEAMGELKMPVLLPAMSHWHSLKDGASLPMLSCYKNAAYEDEGAGTGTLREQGMEGKQIIQSQEHGQPQRFTAAAAGGVEPEMLPSCFNQLAEKPLLGFGKASSSDVDSLASTLRIKADYGPGDAHDEFCDQLDLGAAADLDDVIVLERQLDFSDDGVQSMDHLEDSLAGEAADKCKMTYAFFLCRHDSKNSSVDWPSVKLFLAGR